MYLTEAVKVLKAQGTVEESLLAHIFPLGWEHINFLGEYQFDDQQVPTLDHLHPLRIEGSVYHWNQKPE